MSSIQLFVYNNGLIDLHKQGIDCGYIISDMVCNVFGKLGYRFMKQWDGNYMNMIDCAIESGQYN